MTILLPYVIHYLLNGVASHFHTSASKLCDADAIRLAARHAGPGPKNWIPLGTSRDSALLAAERLGVTKVRWNAAV